MEKGFKVSKIISFLMVFACMAALTFTVFAAGKEGVIKGLTTQDPVSPPYTDEGVLDFDATARAYPPYTAWLKKGTDYAMRGWVWNQNLGWISLYCKDGRNDGRPCGSTNYGVNIAADGLQFRGWVWGDNVGWISFDCKNGSNGSYTCDSEDPKIDYSLKLDTTDPNGDGYVEVAGTSKYAWADSVGWIDFSGVKFPWFTCEGEKDNDKDGCTTGAPCWTEKSTYLCGNDCNDSNASIYPGAPEICGDNIDNDCDGDKDCYDSQCDCDPGGGGWCKPYESSCSNLIDDDCDGLKDCDDLYCKANPVCIGIGPIGPLPFPIPFPVLPVPPASPDFIGGAKIQGGISSQYVGTGVDLQSLGGTSSSFDSVRSVMRKNTLTLLKGLSYENDAAVTVSDFSESKDVSYIDGDHVYGAYPTIPVSGLNLSDTIFNKPKTLVVVGADLFIDGDICAKVNGECQNSGAGKFGIIVLRNLNTSYGENAGGNIYISKNVKNIQANIFAEGTVFTYDPGVDNIYTSNGYYLRNAGNGLYGEPKWPAGYDFAANWGNQLFIQGSLVSRNSLGLAEDGDLPNGQEETYDGQAYLYDLDWLRLGSGLSEEEADLFTDSGGENYSLGIYYIAPKGIPGFSGISSSDSSLGGF